MYVRLVQHQSSILTLTIVSGLAGTTAIPHPTGNNHSNHETQVQEEPCSLQVSSLAERRAGVRQGSPAPMNRALVSISFGLDRLDFDSSGLGWQHRLRGFIMVVSSGRR